MTEQEFEEGTIKAAKSNGWHFGRDDQGNVLWLSEGCLALACFKAGYDFATPAPAPLPSIVGAAAELPVIGTGEVFMLANELLLAACQAESDSRWDTACNGLIKAVKEVSIKLTELSKRPPATLTNPVAAAASIGGGGEQPDTGLAELEALHAAVRELYLDSKCQAETSYMEAAAKEGKMFTLNGDTNKLVVDILKAASTLGLCHLPSLRALLRKAEAAASSPVGGPAETRGDKAADAFVSVANGLCDAIEDQDWHAVYSVWRNIADVLIGHRADLSEGLKQVPNYAAEFGSALPVGVQAKPLGLSESNLAEFLETLELPNVSAEVRKQRVADIRWHIKCLASNTRPDEA